MQWQKKTPTLLQQHIASDMMLVNAALVILQTSEKNRLVSKVYDGLSTTNFKSQTFCE